MAEMSQTSAEAEVLSQANNEPSQAKGEKGKPVYEIGFHLVPTIPEEGVAAVVEKLRAELTKHDAEIIKENPPRKIVFAYTIERAAAGKREKYTEGYFGSIKFAVDTEAISQIEQYVRANRDILRYLLIETVREENTTARRATFASDRLEGEVIKKPAAMAEKPGEVSEEELDKSIEALVS